MPHTHSGPVWMQFDVAVLQYHKHMDRRVDLAAEPDQLRYAMH